MGKNRIKNHKTAAKAMGLKSTFILDDENVFITSFGKGFDADAEKTLQRDEIINHKNTFSVQKINPDSEKGQKLEMHGRTVVKPVIMYKNGETKNGKTTNQTVVDIPAKDSNMLHAKDVIERMYFGKTFEDNIHIQIAYNIMDIKKIFSLYANIVVNSVNNFNRDKLEEDYLGFIFKTQNTYEASKLAYELRESNALYCAFDFDIEKLIEIDPIDYPEIAKMKHEISDIDDTISKRRIADYIYKQKITKYNFNKLTKISQNFANPHPDLKKVDNRCKLALELKNSEILSLRLFANLEKFNSAKNKDYPEIKKLKRELSFIVNEDISETEKILMILEQHGIVAYNFDLIVNNHQKFLDFANCMMRNAMYFPNVFYTDGRFDKNKAYEILRILGNLRQGSFHEDDSSKSWILTIDKNTDERLKNTVSGIFDTKLNKINAEFVKTSKKNLLILQMLYPDNKDIVQQYYDFAVRKAHKNLGFSIKDVRETILTFDDAKHLNEQKFDSVRGKLFTLFDFVIYDYFINNTEISQNLVDELRASLSEEEKCSIYVKYAGDVWSQIKGFILNTVVKKLDSDEINNLSGNIDDSKFLDQIQKPEDISLFAKTIYCISMFLDGKEINMFLSSLINKLENIASLVEALSYNKIPLNLNKDYFIFENSSKYANDLAFVKSIAKMGKTKKAIKQGDEKTKSSVYYDSAALFGEFDKKRVDKLYHLNDEKATSSQKALRNFMLNNVINSNKFSYVTRFINPKTARDIMQSEGLVKYILRQIPESQLIGYCNTAEISYNANEPDFEAIIDELTKMLVKVELSQFLNVKQQVIEGSKQEKEKEKYKAIIGLYLTVLYLIVKSIVRINSSYTVAIGILERDTAMLFPEEVEKNNNFAFSRALTNHFKNNNFLKNKNVLANVDQNAALYSDFAFKLYRNNIAHLSVVRALPKYAKEFKKVNSMYDIYHYIMFKLIIETLEASNSKSANKILKKLNENRYDGKYSIIDSVNKFKTPNRDFIHAINIPFAYNPARYNNLTSKTLFEKGYGK